MTRLTLKQINAIHDATVTLEQLIEYITEDIHYVDASDARKHASETIDILRREFPDVLRRNKRGKVRLTFPEG